MFFLFCVFVLAVNSATCVRDSYGSIPAQPPFPTASYTGTVLAPANYVQNHWSETAKMLRPPNQVSTTQSGCPHIVEPNIVDWHDASIWGGSLPANNTDVTLPAGRTILVSSCSVPAGTVYRTLTVPKTTILIFGDANIEFHVYGMNVKGALKIGSPSCRIRNKITITVHGKRSAQTLPNLESVKGIFVDGAIDIHGTEYFPTWTRLAATAKPGDTVLFIQDCPNWVAGQSIVVTTTELKDARDWHRNEEFNISRVLKTSISATTCVVELTTPVLYTHYGGSEYQAEVGLLSRNILIQGDADSEPTDTTPMICSYGTEKSTYPCEDKFITGFGVHIFVTAPATVGRFSGVEVYRGGQTNVMGRYPIHFHMLGNLTIPDMFYASDCAIHHSFFRCFTIHGTSGNGTVDNGVTLTKNVAYDIVGHCFFCSEDGIEENNTISYNLGAHIHVMGPYWQASHSISQGAYVTANGQSFGSQYTDYVTSNPNLALADDISSAPFYFTNAHVKVYGNAASGGWGGFVFPNLIAPVGLNKFHAPWFCPKNRPLILFQGNSAHSTGFWQGHAAGIYFGGRLYNDAAGNTVYTAGRYLPARQTCDNPRSGSPAGGSCIPRWIQIFDSKVFLANVGLQSWGDRSELVRFEVHDVGISTNVFGQVSIDQMLVQCRTNNRPTLFCGCNSTRIYDCNVRDRQFFLSFIGFQFYDTGQSHIITNSHFKNCKAETNPMCNGGKCNVKVWNYLTHSDEFTPGLMQATKNIKYTNVNFTVGLMVPSTTFASKVTVSGRDANWMDEDGTVTGDFPGVRTNIGSNWTGPDWWRYNSRCINKMENWICPLDPGDSTTSLQIHWATNEAEIGKTVCPNGGATVCPIGGKVTHFGRDVANAFDLAVMPRITGPIIRTQGGWYVNFPGGTPKTLSFDSIQLRAVDLLHLAIPYPSGTSFNIYAWSRYCTPGANPWSPICTHPYKAVDSVAKVRAGNGDLYFYENATKLLHIRIISPYGGFGNYPYFGQESYRNASDAPWNSTVHKTSYFSRNGVDLIVTGSNSIVIYINASCSANPCPFVATSRPDAYPIPLVTTNAPTNAPTYSPPTQFPTTVAATGAPVAGGTNSPTSGPTNAATNAPSNAPSSGPTVAPSRAPTSAPTNAPSPGPTNTPTVAPSRAPTSAPTNAPTNAPSNAPSFGPTVSPTRGPTSAPTNAPSPGPTNSPTNAPSNAPTRAPTNAPSNAPTNGPTRSPTNAPTSGPTTAPTVAPTQFPTPSPTSAPTTAPTFAPTEVPTQTPTVLGATFAPTIAPTNQPTNAPTAPTTEPTVAPTPNPTSAPTSGPTNTPTEAPSNGPTETPTQTPTVAGATFAPTSAPVEILTNAPVAPGVPVDTTITNLPTVAPTGVPVASPVDACGAYTDCYSCLKNGCYYCPWWENRQMSHQCQSKGSAMCKRRRDRSCEDTNSQLVTNITISIKDQVIAKISIEAGRNGIDITVLSIEDPSLANGIVSYLIHFKSNDFSWSDSQKEMACNILLKALSSTYEITDSRMTCNFNNLQKRAIDDGLATLTVSETSDFASQEGGDSGIPIWIIIVAVVGGIVLFVALVIIIILIAKSSSKKKNQWEKY